MSKIVRLELDTDRLWERWIAARTAIRLNPSAENASNCIKMFRAYYLRTWGRARLDQAVEFERYCVGRMLQIYGKRHG